MKLDNASCEVLETVLSRVQTNSLDLEKTNLEDEVMHCVLQYCCYWGRGGVRDIGGIGKEVEEQEGVREGGVPVGRVYEESGRVVDLVLVGIREKLRLI